MSIKFRKQLEKFVDTNTQAYVKSHGIKEFSFYLETSSTPKMFVKMTNDSVTTIEGEEEIIKYINNL